MNLYKIKKSNIDRNGRGLYAAKDIKEGTRIINYAKKYCNGKVGSILEGGYNIDSTAKAANEHVNALLEFN